MKKTILALICCLFLTSCAGVQLVSHVVKSVIPWGGESSSTGKYKVGSPYTINGVRYYPSEDWNYDETGIASWYGGGDDSFHGKKTANGEIYNTYDLTAAHKTLPMPSFVRVTNLENGHRVILRINDRGPYVDGRIIDVSKKAAQLLGFANKGTARVRVQILKRESMKIAEAAKKGKDISKVRFPRDTRNLDLNRIPQREIVNTVPVTPTDIYIQTGAFSVQKNAEMQKVKLASLGNVNIEPAMVNGTQYYRVKIGPISSVEDADTMMLILKEMGVNSRKITIK